MEQIHDRVAGLDLHRDEVAVCVRMPGPRGGVHAEKARFKTTTGGLAVLAGWLAEREVALAAMEATGVYWKPVYYALEEGGVAEVFGGGVPEAPLMPCPRPGPHSPAGRW